MPSILHHHLHRLVKVRKDAVRKVGGHLPGGDPVVEGIDQGEANAVDIQVVSLVRL